MRYFRSWVRILADRVRLYLREKWHGLSTCDAKRNEGFPNVVLYGELVWFSVSSIDFLSLL